MARPCLPMPTAGNRYAILPPYDCASNRSTFTATNKESYVEIETILKLATAIVGMISAAKIIFELSSGSKLKLREEYRFAKEFLKDLSQEPKLHPLAIEKGYYAIAGTSAIKSKEIEYILSLENPDRCLKDYVLSRGYLEHISLHENTKIDFKARYKEKWPRTWRKGVQITLYFIFGTTAVLPLLIHKQLDFQIKQAIIFSIITIPTFGLIAFESLRSFIKICRAEALVKSQSKHSKLILIKESSA